MDEQESTDTDNSRVCHGCHDPKPEDVELRTFRMEYGGYETLCPDCIQESHAVIDCEVPTEGDRNA